MASREATTTHASSPEASHRWRNTILAGLANYIDAGSIVSGSAALAMWASAYNLSPSFLGILGAFSANAISAGVGALIGGRLCDRYGRKRIYQYDMLFYAFGMLWLVFATQPWMLVIGFVLVGLAVGADIPASWSLIAEEAPDRERAKHSGVAQVLWYLGPVVVLVLFFVLAPLGLLGARIVFAHLAILALALTFLRARMKESRRWEDAKEKSLQNGGAARAASWRTLLKPRHIGSMAFLIGMYGMWNLWAGTNGFFLPYILRTVGNQSQAVSVALQAGYFALGIASLLFIFMRLADRVNQRLLFAISALAQVVGMSLFAVFPLTLPIAMAHLTIMALASGIGAQSFFQLWSAELFPTMVRSTAQGVTFAVVRIALGFWSFFVPVLTATGFHTLAWILTGFLVVSGLIGTIWAPRNEGKSLEELDALHNQDDQSVETATAPATR
ncbi:MAG: MFS transporter [Terricaulis sp.]